jgi:two-component system CheB/CheR fusion protein
VDELDRANADLRNLFDSTQVATVFLDRHLVIRSFTPAVTAIFNLLASDVGRPLADFASHLDGVDLRREMRRVMEGGNRRAAGHRAQRRRALPHAAAALPGGGRGVDGVVATFFDVTKVVEARCWRRWWTS